MSLEKFDALSETDKAKIGKMVLKDLIISSLLTFQYVAMLFVAMIVCAMAASVAALTPGAHIILAGSMTVGIFVFANKHMGDRRKALSAQVKAIVDPKN